MKLLLVEVASDPRGHKRAVACLLRHIALVVVTRAGWNSATPPSHNSPFCGTIDVPHNVNTMQWYAIRTKSNRESVVLASLVGKDLEAFLPTIQKASPRGRIFAPLFPGYLFCRFDVERRQPIVITPGVAYIVSNGRIPLPVDDEEVTSLKSVIASDTPLERHEFVPVGQLVWIRRGPLAGTCGRIIDQKQDRLVVSISMLQRSVSVSICREWLEPEYAAARVA